MPIISGGSTGAGGGKVFDTTLSVDTASIDTGANAIPSSFAILEVFFIARTDEATNFSNVGLTFNGDTAAHYDTEQVQSVNNVVSGGPTLAATSIQIVVPGTTQAAGVFGVARFVIVAYGQATAQKVVDMTLGIIDTAGANSYVRAQTANMRAAAAINQLAVAPVTAAKKLKTGSRLIAYVR